MRVKRKRSLETAPNGGDDNEPTACAICMDDISVRGKLSVCSHWFCFTCIHEWSKNTNTCPLCKRRFRCITKVHIGSSGSPPRRVRVPDKDQSVHYDEEENRRLAEQLGAQTSESSDLSDDDYEPSLFYWTRNRRQNRPLMSTRSSVVTVNLDVYDMDDSFIDDSEDDIARQLQLFNDMRGTSLSSIRVFMGEEESVDESSSSSEDSQSEDEESEEESSSSSEEELDLGEYLTRRTSHTRGRRGQTSIRRYMPASSQSSSSRRNDNSSTRANSRSSTRGSRSNNRGSGSKDRGSRSNGRVSRSDSRGSRSNDRMSRSNIRGSRSNNRALRSNDRGSRSNDRESRSGGSSSRSKHRNSAYRQQQMHSRPTRSTDQHLDSTEHSPTTSSRRAISANATELSSQHTSSSGRCQRTTSATRSSTQPGVRSARVQAESRIRDMVESEQGTSPGWIRKVTTRDGNGAVRKYYIPESSREARSSAGVTRDDSSDESDASLGGAPASNYFPQNNTSTPKSQRGIVSTSVLNTSGVVPPTPPPGNSRTRNTRAITEGGLYKNDARAQDVTTVTSSACPMTRTLTTEARVHNARQQCQGTSPGTVSRDSHTRHLLGTKPFSDVNGNDYHGDSSHTRKAQKRGAARKRIYVLDSDSD